jgi:hypothetical protein
LDFGVFWGDDYGGGYFVVGVEEGQGDLRLKPQAT